MLPATNRRVAQNTCEHINREIAQETQLRIARYISASPEQIDQRLQELNEEWDVERVLEANASSLMLIGLTLGATVDRRWFIAPGVIAAFLLQHALQGWCPPIPVLRRLGVRTSAEINRERYALKILRGDFQELPEASPGESGAKPLMQATAQ